MTGVLDVLNSSSPNRRIVKFCVNGSLQAEWDTLINALDAGVAGDTDPNTSLAMEHTAALIEQMEAIRDQVAASEVTFEFQQIPWTSRVNLQADHPPRDGNFIDQTHGYNVVTFHDAVVRRCCVAVIGVDEDRVTEIPESTWDALLGHGEEGTDEYLAGSLNAKQVERLVRAAMDVNDGDTRVPPSARSLLTSQDSGPSLAQPSPGTSPRSGSAAGSRRTSRKSSTTKKAASPK